MAANLSGSLSIVDGKLVFCPTAGQEITAETIAEMQSKGISIAPPEEPTEPDSGRTGKLSSVGGATNSGYASTAGTMEAGKILPADFTGGEPMETSGISDPSPGVDRSQDNYMPGIEVSVVRTGPKPPLKARKKELMQRIIRSETPEDVEHLGDGRGDEAIAEDGQFLLSFWRSIYSIRM